MVQVGVDKLTERVVFTVKDHADLEVFFLSPVIRSPGATGHNCEKTCEAKNECNDLFHETASILFLIL